MSRVFMYTGTRPSQTALALARELGVSKIKTRNSRYSPKLNDLIINYGCSYWSFPGPVPLFINSPRLVSYSIHKGQCLHILKGGDVSCPEFTINSNLAEKWIEEGKPLIARKSFVGSGGRDAEYMEQVPNNIREFVFFSQYIKKSAEYRVHVINGEVVDVQQKRKRNGVDADFKIRNHDRGWVFCRNDIDAPDEEVLKESVNAVSKLGLRFGAVDVIWNNHHRKAYILEVNTAPGLEGTTFNTYVQKFGEMIDNA